MSYAARLRVCSCQAARIASGLRWPFFSISHSALYLALEDTDQRGESRLAKVLGPGIGGPPNLHLHWKWRRTDDYGLELIDCWCDAVENPVLAVVDTVQKIRPLVSAPPNVYADDCLFHCALQEKAHQRRIAILAATHVRKGAMNEDWVQTINGSYGVGGTDRPPLGGPR